MSSEKSPRRQKQGNKPSRISRRTVLGLGAAALAGTTAAIYGLSPKETDSERELRVLREDIKKWDQELKTNPEQFNTIAQKVAVTAARFFLQEIGADPVEAAGFSSKVFLHNATDYAKAVQEDTRCLNYNPGDLIAAQVAPLTDKIRVNKDKIPTSSGVAASFLFTTLLHEYHHLRPRPKTIPLPLTIRDPNTNEVFQVKFSRGAVLYRDAPNNSADQECYISGQAFSDLEEAIVVDSTERMANKLKLTTGVSARYENLKNLYRKEVVDKLFHGNPAALRGFQQESDPVMLLATIGLRLGAPQSQSYLAGFNYIASVFKH